MKYELMKIITQIRNWLISFAKFVNKIIEIMTIYSVYDQVAELLAKLDPTKVMALKASSEMNERFENLAQKYKNEQISVKEKDELDHYIVLERLMRLAKIRAVLQ
jgi:hypothetical protein